MSYARPGTKGPKTPLHPAAEAAARAVSSAGWKVTSIFRADAAHLHSKGAAVDVAPLRAQEGGFGHKTAAAVERLLAARCPRYHYDVISELDHVHIDVSKLSYNRTGINTPAGVIFTMAYPDNNYDPELPVDNVTWLFEGGEPFLPDEGIGEPNDGDEWGEPQEITVTPDNRCALTGEPVLLESEFETGGPRRGNRKVVGRRRRKKAARRAGRTAGGEKSGMVTPSLAKNRARAAAFASAVYEAYENISGRTSGPVPFPQRMRQAEAISLSTSIFQNPAFNPQLFPFTIIDGTTLRLDIDSSLNPILGPGILFDWIGDYIRIVIGMLNASPASFNVIRVINGVTQAYILRLKEAKNGATLIQINSGMFAATARITNARLVTAAVASGLNRITISGLPTGAGQYSATLQHFVPGDNEIENIIAVLGAGKV